MPKQIKKRAPKERENRARRSPWKVDKTWGTPHRRDTQREYLMQMGARTKAGFIVEQAFRRAALTARDRYQMSRTRIFFARVGVTLKMVARQWLRPY